MKVIDFKQLICSDRHVVTEGFSSTRGVVASDRMGFGVHHTVVYPTSEPQRWHYKNHLEACYCISGEARLVNESTGQTYSVKKDTCYLLDQNDPHTLSVVGDIPCVLISIFNPPCKGHELHNAEGSYDA